MVNYDYYSKQYNHTNTRVLYTCTRHSHCYALKWVYTAILLLQTTLTNDIIFQSVENGKRERERG